MSSPVVEADRGPGHEPDHGAELQARYDELARRHSAELRLASAAASGGGVAEVVAAASGVTANPIWLLDPSGRVVARSRDVRGSDFRAPDVRMLLERHGPVDVAAGAPIVVPPQPARGVMRRHLVAPVSRDGALHAWVVVAEVSVRLRPFDCYLARRAAFHLAGEFSLQRRLAHASWNARAALARQMIRGSQAEDDLAASADYLGVRADAARVIVYIADASAEELRDEHHLAGVVADRLAVEVLATRGREGCVLLIEVPDGAAGVAFVHRVKQAMSRVVAELGEPGATVGVSTVAGPSGLQRAYRETREVVLCVDRFATPGDRVIAVDDLGPARLFVANSDTESVTRYARDVLGSLLTGAPGTADLLRTLQCYFVTGRSVRESAARLGIHENTVRLRMGKVHDLTGLDVAADANDQLSAQTALLVLRLEGHAALSSFPLQGQVDEAAQRKETA